MTNGTESDQQVMNGEAVYYTVNCFCSWVFVPQENDRQMYYLACPSCKKKVSDEEQGFRCERCDKIYQDAVPTYNFTAKVSDLSSTVTVQIMGDEVGKEFIGMPCTEFYELKDDLEQIKL